MTLPDPPSDKNHFLFLNPSLSHINLFLLKPYKTDKNLHTFLIFSVGVKKKRFLPSNVTPKERIKTVLQG